MQIRPATPQDAPAIWTILEPVIRAGDTYALPCDMSEQDALAYWTAADRETWVAEIDGGSSALTTCAPIRQGAAITSPIAAMSRISVPEDGV